MPKETHIYPASLSMGDGPAIQKARIYLDGDGSVRVFARPRGGEIALVASAEAASYEQMRGRTFKISFPDGTEWTGKRHGDCGCSDPLKRFDPRTWQA